MNENKTILQLDNNTISNANITYVPWMAIGNTSASKANMTAMVRAVTAQYPTGVKTDLSLQNVNNTSDANKPISTATQTALDGKQDAISIANQTVLGRYGSTGSPQELALDGANLTISGNGTLMYRGTGGGNVSNGDSPTFANLTATGNISLPNAGAFTVLQGYQTAAYGAGTNGTTGTAFGVRLGILPCNATGHNYTSALTAIEVGNFITLIGAGSRTILEVSALLGDNGNYGYVFDGTFTGDAFPADGTNVSIYLGSSPGGSDTYVTISNDGVLVVKLFNDLVPTSDGGNLTLPGLTSADWATASPATLEEAITRLARANGTYPIPAL